VQAVVRSEVFEVVVVRECILKDEGREEKSRAEERGEAKGVRKSGMEWGEVRRGEVEQKSREGQDKMGGKVMKRIQEAYVEGRKWRRERSGEKEQEKKSRNYKIHNTTETKQHMVTK
jgi:hypothetical protein